MAQPYAYGYQNTQWQLDKQVRERYTDAPRVLADIMQAIHAYGDLTPKTGNFTHNNGQQEDVVYLQGTIPIVYIGNNQTYNIPVSIWLLRGYPNNPPQPYVVPTPTMRIQPGEHVDPAGVIYLPYLHSWNSRSSTLMGLIGVMRTEFGRVPPVYSVQAPPGAAAQVVSPAQPVITPTQSIQGATSQSSSDYEAQNSDVIRMSLESHLKEKIMQNIQQIYASKQAVFAKLKENKESLEAGNDYLATVFQQIEEAEKKVDKNIQVLQKTDDIVAKQITTLEQSGAIDVDEAVVTTAPLYNQLLNLVAEDNTVEDILYHLGKALQRKVIDADTFLKHVRNVSQKQFETRVLIQKARRKARLPE